MNLNTIYFGFVIGLINAIIIYFIACRIEDSKDKIRKEKKEEFDNLQERLRNLDRLRGKYIDGMEYWEKEYKSLEKILNKKILKDKHEAKELIKYYLDVLIEDCEGEEVNAIKNHKCD